MLKRCVCVCAREEGGYLCPSTLTRLSGDPWALRDRFVCFCVGSSLGAATTDRTGPLSSSSTRPPSPQRPSGRNPALRSTDPPVSIFQNNFYFINFKIHHIFYLFIFSLFSLLFMNGLKSKYNSRNWCPLCIVFGPWAHFSDVWEF